MGTNYYLEPVPAVCPECHHDATMELHIGKSSSGWVFTWRGYRPVDPDGDPIKTLDLASPTAWFEMLGKTAGTGSHQIRDEYGKPWTLAEFTALVKAKREPRADGTGARRADDQTEWTAEGDDIVFEEFS